jgi:Transposase IS4
MEFECDSDGSTDMGDESELESDTNDDDTQMQLDRQLYEPEPNASTNEFATNAPIEQLEAQIYKEHLAKLHVDIKARAQIPTKPAYQKLYRTWPPRPFSVRSIPDSVQSPIHYFELFWTPEVWASLVANTNKYAQYRIAQQKAFKNCRYWTPVNLYEMRIFIALLLYISYIGISSIKAYWSSSLTTHLPMQTMPLHRFEQIQRYFHISDPYEDKPISRTWYGKVWPLYQVLRQQFKAYVVLGQNVSFDEMMVPYTGRSSHILKMKNKPISEGFKIWALCDHGYTWDFLWYSRLKSK